jgi:hypothetical protein
MKRFNYALSAVVLAGAAVVSVLSLASCGATDVVARVANASFGAVAAALPATPSWSESDYGWEIRSPAGDLLMLSSDLSRNNPAGGAADLDKPDAEFAFDAAPFIAAGLNIGKLPAVDGIKYEIEDGMFMIHFELGADRFSPDAKQSLASTFAELVRTQRARIGYHEKLDHYGIKLGNGNMFEWAKDMSVNDKDIVFVLNPEPFVVAGVDPANIDGWIYAKVETKDESGKTVFVDKLLKPFNLK